MNYVRIIILLLFLPITAQADHISGGEMFYTYVGFSNGNHQYQVTLKQFRSCFTPNRQFADPITIAIFDRRNHTRIRDISVPRTQERQISDVSSDPCITRAPNVCYFEGYWTFTVSLPPNEGGYLLVSQVNNRINGIENLMLGYSNIGATYTAEIPGGTYAANSSAHFTGNDLVTICAENRFSYSFGATDANTVDELRYGFCEAYMTTGYSPPGSGGGFGGGGGSQGSNPPVPPPYDAVPYGNGFTSYLPLGSRVHIDAQTGLITGFAPHTGVYVITVCVEEIRNGVVIAVQRKDLQINITGCTMASATLEDTYMLCKNSLQLQIANQSNSPLINRYDWEVRDPIGNILFESEQKHLNFLLPNPGDYTIKLVTNRDGLCSDSIEAQVKAYPGFEPNFTAVGTCLTTGTTFQDLSSSQIGVVDKWSWDFGALETFTDISSLQHPPPYLYRSIGTKNVRLIVGNSVGCLDTIQRPIQIISQAVLNLQFTDTLICPPDRLTLLASSPGSISWDPVPYMDGGSPEAPTVSPLQTTSYTVTVNQDGCMRRESVLVRVVPEVRLSTRLDTTICEGDPTLLPVQSNALQITWIDPNGPISGNIRQPTVSPTQTTTYQVVGRISNCTGTAQARIQTVPYPQVFAGNDTTICFGTPAFLRGSVAGSNYFWDLIDAPLQHTIYPTSTITYNLYSYEDQGCPKPGIDAVTIEVRPPIQASAGNDTAVVVGQPLQLQASGGVQYQWTAHLNLQPLQSSNPSITFHSPAAEEILIVRVLDEAQCYVDTSLRVRVYNTLPIVFVPTAFTPNGDGINDFLRPIAAGMRQIHFFRIYNRWGELVFSTNQNGHGWDGRIQGQLQASNTYVWQISATDFLNFDYFLTGTATLIR
jgi:gliding motility-associated-like protein